MKAELLVLVVSLLCWTEAEGEGELLNDNFTKVNDDNRHFNYNSFKSVSMSL